ncbi:hypothetical protein [Christensenella intestinihominis]|uniref:hypothetical protein n=1 Tax=Christensenella intestinihominis TaxID=1851429 RepID=UPI00083314C9|nr:hypothetical protein [Christensenella intestinihominis]
MSEYAKHLENEATAPVYDDIVYCVCGHEAYAEDAVQYDGEWYCSDECKNKAVFKDATPEDHKEFVLSEWGSFLDYLKVNEQEFIREKIDDQEPARDMWAEIFKEYAKDDLYAFADWYENREPIPYRRSA